LISKIRNFFKNLDLVDLLLAAGFVICFTWVGVTFIDFPLWLAFPVLAIVLLGLAKNRRDRMRAEDDDPEKVEKP
jgi:hypothetical protein